MGASPRFGAMTAWTVILQAHRRTPFCDTHARGVDMFQKPPVQPITDDSCRVWEHPRREKTHPPDKQGGQDSDWDMVLGDGPVIATVFAGL